MWSPEGRKQNAQELRRVADKLLRYRQLADRFAGYFQPDSDNSRQLRQIRSKLEDLRARALDREKRLAKGVVKIGVVGLEKQGKSAFLSAWLESEKLLPSEAERCTWSTTVVEPSEEGQFSAIVTFYKEDDFKARISSYFDALEPGSVERWSLASMYSNPATTFGCSKVAEPIVRRRTPSLMWWSPKWKNVVRSPRSTGALRANGRPVTRIWRPF